MKLWLISQDINNDYDTFDSAVVAADTEDEARRIHPLRAIYGDGRDWEFGSHQWVKTPEQVTAKLIGEADPSVPAGVVLASFNAG